ncbi:hypothetical protein SAICODRAFT_202212 [Saitoella complicata NRRL Y-17804]|uniref:uncharacterized protein n=1 Tax=Saitoella complicata (strain BCRC 22490 / CBS 7301 / JCM 7358 / NBRC 10748 / NRRL Y-17804) TaxID=698492 RepID=UPI000866A7AE|nr:uncharacterized protein SAICODRAFT_202212 [Saitoella complicata NRRL Y-17804]ODQ54647.1 hypothetical protein SAICODRAFT_202212 [Saitoella complicata NRRL Y-17804]
MPLDDPSLFRQIIGFLLVGACWGLTNSFIRTAQNSSTSAATPDDRVVKRAWAVIKRPRYFVPLVINMSGSFWYYVLLGEADLSYAVPVTNSLAFIFTVLGDFLAESKIPRWNVVVGMGLVAGGVTVMTRASLGLGRTEGVD